MNKNNNQRGGPRSRHTKFQPDRHAKRTKIAMPITPMEREPDHRPSCENIEMWQAGPALIRSDGPWQAKDLSLLLPVAAAEARKNGPQADSYGGDAGRALKVARLDRHLAATCVFTCAQCGDPALVIEVVDAEDHTLTFYRRGADGAWAQVDVIDAIADEMVMVRQLFMGMIPAAETYIKQIGDAASGD